MTNEDFLFYEGKVDVQTYSLLGRRKEQFSVSREKAERIWEKEVEDGFPEPTLCVAGERVEGY